MVVCSSVDRAAIKSGGGWRWLVMGRLLVKVELSGSDEGCLESDTPRLLLLATILKPRTVGTRVRKAVKRLRGRVASEGEREDVISGVKEMEVGLSPRIDGAGALRSREINQEFILIPRIIFPKPAKAGTEPFQPYIYC
jgi:hypothetical protein